MDSVRDLPCGRGCPIRRSGDQRVLASPPGFSQRATSFIASWRQGIHQMPLPQRLIAKPVARRDKTRDQASGIRYQIPNSFSLDRARKQRVSHEDTLFSWAADGRRKTQRPRSPRRRQPSCCPDTPSSLVKEQYASRRKPAGKPVFSRSKARGSPTEAAPKRPVLLRPGGLRRTTSAAGAA
jgi:hypothetical protein